MTNNQPANKTYNSSYNTPYRSTNSRSNQRANKSANFSACNTNCYTGTKLDAHGYSCTSRMTGSCIAMGYRIIKSGSFGHITCLSSMAIRALESLGSNWGC